MPPVRHASAAPVPEPDRSTVSSATYGEASPHEGDRISNSGLCSVHDSPSATFGGIVIVYYDRNGGPMLRNKILLIALAAASLAFAVQPASAQATRTWVSGVGDDANPCSRTAPCKTFAGAISKTAAGGEIYVSGPWRLRCGDDHEVHNDRWRRRPGCVHAGLRHERNSCVGGCRHRDFAEPEDQRPIGVSEPWPERRPVSVRRRASHRELHDLRLLSERHQYQPDLSVPGSRVRDGYSRQQ